MSDKIRKPRTEKTINQKIASAQMRLNRLKHKSKQETKQIETRQKIILGAEVAKALDCDIFTVDKELVLGMLLDVPQLHQDDKVRYRKNGMLFLASMKGRKT
ncbi:conjugal transfer protein TraD [Salmonella enterica]